MNTHGSRAQCPGLLGGYCITTICLGISPGASLRCLGLNPPELSHHLSQIQQTPWSSQITLHFQRGSPPGNILSPSHPFYLPLPSPPSTPHKPPTTIGQDGSAGELTNPATVMLNRLPETSLRCGPQWLGGSPGGPRLHSPQQ